MIKINTILFVHMNKTALKYHSFCPLRQNFLYFSRGSLSETKTWLTKASNRKLISEEKFSDLIDRYNSLGIKLNNYINTIGNSGSSNSNDHQ